MTDPLVSQRAAGRLLAQGVGLSRRHGEGVLAAGLAGTPISIGGMKLYELARVERLLTWPRVDASYVDVVCGDAYVVSRRAQTKDEGWNIAWIGTTWLQIHVERRGPIPFVVTTSGFVVSGADITGVRFDEHGRTRFDLSDPGAWFEQLEGTRFVTGRGRDCIVRLPGWSPRPLKYAGTPSCGTMEQ